MGFYMDESDEGPATGGIARDPVLKQEAKKNALAALVTDVEQWQWGGHRRARRGPEVHRQTDTLEVRWPLAVQRAQTCGTDAQKWMFVKDLFNRHGGEVREISGE